MKTLLDALTDWMRRAGKAWREAQLRREIAHLDEHLLKDIGLWNGQRR